MTEHTPEVGSAAAASPRGVLVLATIDTKAAEVDYLVRGIRERGQRPYLVDLSLREHAYEEPAADVTAAALASETGMGTADLHAMVRAEAMPTVAAAAGRIASAAADRGEIHAAIGIGGGTGSWLVEHALAHLPHGFGKLLVSTLTGGDAGVDIMVLPSVADIAGLNRLLTPVMDNAVAAVCGMAADDLGSPTSGKPAVALTMFGVTTTGGNHVRRFLEEAGCEVVVFHANGTGGRTMERLARAGEFSAVLDWTTSEVTDELVGGICTAGPGRLDAAGSAGVPQLVVPGAVDVINVAGTIPERFADRRHHWHLPSVPLIRTSSEESGRIGAWMANKLNAARGPAAVLVPERGFSALDAAGGPFADPEADAAWTRALRAELDPGVSVDVVPQHINDEEFARTAASTVLSLAGLSGVARPAATPS